MNVFIVDYFKTYTPYDFTDKNIFVHTIEVESKSFIGSISKKLPDDLINLKGIIISGQAKGTKNFLGRIVLRFDEGIITPVNLLVPHAGLQTGFEHPYKLNEKLKPSSTMQGFYEDFGTAAKYPFRIKIYLIYDAVSLMKK